ncbi:MAG TPA: hypothetical protein DCQ31_17990, partial [Bacteroidales bacterium]|nr:hypothetical protein [Bacteroidales bacterium]
MKKLKIFYLAALALTIMYTTGCKSVQDMVNRASEVTWNVAPGVLEMHGEQVQITITGKIPAKYFHKKGILVVSPVLKYGKNEKAFDQKTFQGEAVQDNNPIINFATGGQISFSATIPYTDDMQVSELELRLTAKDNKGVKFDMPVIKLADGVIITPRLVKNGLGVDNEGFNNAGQYGLTASEGVKLPGTVVSTLKADIKYDLQKFDVKKTELTQDDITKLLNAIKADTTGNFKGLNISSYASPEGDLDLNTGLSVNRGKAADKVLKDDFKKAKVKLDPALLTASTTPEDWDGFKTELANSSLKDKGLILNVLSMYTDPIVREREIKNLSEAYEELKSAVLPVLRRSVFEARFETGTRTDAEIISMMKSDPKALTNEEMLHAAAVTQNLNEKIELFKITSQYFPNNWRAYNGMGLVYMNLNKLTEAKEAFEKAKSLDNNEKVNNNLGVAYFALGENDKASQFFNSA